jgi:PAS domain S-box-containing protein
VEYWELRDLFENAPVNLHMVGGDGLIKYASRSELAGMGYASEAYVGQHIARFHADQAVIDGMLEDLVDGRPLVNFSATLFHKDGSELPVMIYSNSRMRDGGFLNTRCFTVPVPKLRKAEVDVRKKFAWPRNEDFGFTIRGQSEPTSQANPATLALKYIASRKRPEESLGFLACVSQVLGTSQPFDAMIGEVLALSVPFLADFASVDLVSGHVAHASTPSLRMRIDGILDHLAADGEAVELSMELVRTSGKLEVRFNLSSDPGPSSERSAQLLGMGVQSLIIAPLTIRGAGRVGTMTFLRENLPSRHDFGPADSALAEECARRISFAIEVEELSSHQPGRS